jgi:uncharacterized membrane protein
MNESTLVNLFLIIRVFLVGGLLFALPHIMRKGLVFGVYIGEGTAKGDSASQLLHSWRQGCVLVMVLALGVGLGISAAGWPVAGNLTGTAVLLCSALVLYLRVYAKARKLIPPEAARQAQKTVVSLDVDRSRGQPFARATLAICLITSLLVILYAVASYRVMPDLVPALSGTGSMSEKVFIDTIYFPVLALVVSSLFSLLALFTAGAKHSLRDGTGSYSAEAQDAFQLFFTRLLCWIAILFCALLTLISVQIVRVGLSATHSIGHEIWWAPGILVIFMLIGLIRIMRKYGQGGSFREYGSAETPLTGALADNDHWVWGLFYFNRDDSSLMVENRFGVGYTLNYAKSTAILFTVTYLVLTIGLAALGLVRVLS